MKGKKLTYIFKSGVLLLSMLIPMQTMIAGIRDEYQYKALTADGGLSQNFVDGIFQDSKGFLWFATWGGLDRFDGYEIQKYNVQNKLLNTNFIHCITEDRFARLWAGTDLGVRTIDLNTGAVVDCLKDFPQYKQLMNTSISSLLVDTDGKLWVAGDFGLACLVFDRKGALANFYSLSLSSVSSLAEDVKGRIWLGMKDGEVHILANSMNGQFTFEKCPPTLRMPGSDVRRIFIDKMGTIWIGTTTQLVRFNPHTGVQSQYQSKASSINSLPNSFVNDIAQDQNGHIWVATLGGLAMFNPETDCFESVLSDGSPYSINNNYLNALCVDHQNILWIATEKGGVNWMYPKRKVFLSYVHNPKRPGSLNPATVNSILEDRKGRLWVGQVEGGLHLKNRGSDDFRHYYHTSSPSSLSHNTVSKIMEDNCGRIWAATWGEGLNMLRDDENGFVRFPVDGKKGSLADIFVSDLAEDVPNQGIWVGTSTRLQFLDLRNGRFTTVFEGTNLKYPPQQINNLLIDKQRRLWVATNFGLYCIFLSESDVRTKRFRVTYFRYELNLIDSDHLARITCIYEDRLGNLWFGSNGNGLYQMLEFKASEPDARKPKGWIDAASRKLGRTEVCFIKYDNSSGLSDNVVYTILEDDKGRLWMSTNNGLCRFSPFTGKSTNFYKSDGLLSNQFFWMAACKGKDGTLYFGNVLGVNHVQPSRIRTNDYMPEVKLISLHVLNELIQPGTRIRGRIFLKKNLFETDELVLPRREKSFSIEFSSMDYESPEKTRYQYMLEGFDPDWVETDATRRYVHYTNLKQGHYIFKVRCTNSDGIWSDRLTTLKIHIKPPFHQTFLFRLALMALVLCLLWYYVQGRMNKLREGQRKLEEKVRERTLKVEQQKNQLREQAESLEKTLQELVVQEEAVLEQNALLREQNEKILAQKEQLEEYNKRVEQLNQEKISIFTNITHEFKTPITLILGPIQRMLGLTKDAELLQQLHLAQRNSRLLLSLVNQLMDFRKIESGLMKLNVTQADIVELCREILISFGDMVERRGVQCSLNSSLEKSILLIDEDKIRKILTNLLSNAVKFTPDNGSILVRLGEVMLEEKPWLRLSVTDSGPGIPEEELELIFESFYQGKNQNIHQPSGQSGTGIGLYLCRELARLLGGKIYAMNNSGGGSRFVLEIPMEPAVSASVAGEELSGNPKGRDEESFIRFSDDKPLMLLAEDNEDMRQFIRSFMEKDFHLLEAPDGDVAWTLTQRYVPDIIVSDVMMPGKDGFQFCRLVKSHFTTSHIPVILLTALSSVEKHLEGLQSGADEYISKPFDEKLFVARIHNLLEMRQRLHQRFQNEMSTSSLDINDDSPDKRFMDKCLNILETNYSNPDFDVAEFVQESGISRSLMHKKLDTLVGQSASRFIRNYRLNKARELFESHKGMNVSEVAYAVGFNDPKYFTRCFTKQFGVNPSNWEPKTE